MIQYIHEQNTINGNQNRKGSCIMADFIVTFKWYDTDTFCTNLCKADSADEAKAHYEKKYSNVNVREAKDWEVESYTRRGMPVTDLSKETVKNVQ